MEFMCENCGVREDKNVLPGKHAVLGTVNLLESEARCCSNPQYFDSQGLKENTVSRDLKLLSRA